MQIFDTAHRGCVPLKKLAGLTGSSTMFSPLGPGKNWKYLIRLTGVRAFKETRSLGARFFLKKVPLFSATVSYEERFAGSSIIFSQSAQGENANIWYGSPGALYYKIKKMPLSTILSEITRLPVNYILLHELGRLLIEVDRTHKKIPRLEDLIFFNPSNPLEHSVNRVKMGEISQI